MGKQWRPCRLSFLVPDLSPARCARRLVTRGFADRATSFITTKMRACSQATRTIKHVPALLQTAVFFHIPYSVNEKSSLLLCPGFRNINLRTPGSFGTLFPRGSDELSR